MDLSGLAAVTTAAEMQAWLLANCLSPISPVMTGTDLGIIMQKIISVTGSSISTVNNGLTLNDGTLQFGGDVIQDTRLNLGNNNFAMFATYPGLCDSSLSISSQNIFLRTDMQLNSAIIFTDTGGEYMRYVNGSTNQYTQIFAGPGQIAFYDSINQAGAKYDADYSAQGVALYGDRWIPDLGYILSLLAAASSSVKTISSGLHLNGNDARLGGTLSESANINLNNNSFFVYSGNPGITGAYNNFRVDGTTIGGTDSTGNYSTDLSLNFAGPNPSAILEVIDASHYPPNKIMQISLREDTSAYNGMLITDSIYGKGFRYAADYSAANASNPRWLVDKGYVDNAVSGNTYTPPQATETTSGIVALATVAQALAGTDDTKAMTALKTLSLILNQKKTVSYQINPVNISEVSVLMENAGQVTSLLIAGATNAKLKIGTGGTYPSGTQTYPFSYSAGDRVFISFTYTDQTNTTCNIKLKCQDN